MGFLKKAKKKNKFATKQIVKNAVKAAKMDQYAQGFLKKEIGRVLDGRLKVMSEYAIWLLHSQCNVGKDELMEFCLRIPNMCWATNYSWNKHGMLSGTPVVTWEEIRHNLEREIRFKLPRWPRLGNKNEINEYIFNELDKAETLLLDLCRVMFGWGRVRLTRFEAALRRIDMSADYCDYIRYRNNTIDKLAIAAKPVDEKTFYDGKFEKPRIKYASEVA